MYRFLLRPKWIVFHIAIAAATIGMLYLATWQFGKYQARNDFKSMVRTREQAEPRPIQPLLAAGKTPSDLEWFRLTATGSYLADRQLRQINVSQGGVVGANVITAFQVDGGPILIINRGFVADGQPIPDPVSGSVVVGGRARLSQARRTGELSDNGSADNDEIRRIDLAVVQQRLGQDVAPVYLDLIASKPAQGSSPIPIPAPALDSGPPHLSYTFQWVIFSLCAIVGWVFAVRRSARNRLRPPEST
jgi:cytochrome oxidase assembly protein ShyY1